MMDRILDTKTKVRIARLFAERGEALQVSDVARVLKISKSRASECLRDLSEKRILESRLVGRSVVYALSKSKLAKAVAAALTQERRLLAEIEEGAVSEIRKLRPVSIALFGSVLRGLKAGSDIDFMVLYENKFEKEKIYEISAALTKKFGFDVSILAMEVGEFRRKAKSGEEFVINILAENKLLYGKELEGIVWQGK